MDEARWRGAFFCDVDGTLLPHGRKQVDPALLALIREATDKAFLFCVSSGRFHLSARSLFSSVSDVVVFSASNGAKLVYRGRPLGQDVSIAYDVACALHDDAIAAGCTLLVASGDTMYLFPIHTDAERLRYYSAKPYARFIHDMGEIEGDIQQMTVICPDSLEPTLASFRRRWAATVNVAVSGRNMFDLSASNKGEAVERICSAFSIPVTHSYAFGDDENDLSMLRASGKGYLMHTASDELKRMVGDHCTDLAATIRSILESR